MLRVSGEEYLVMRIGFSKNKITISDELTAAASQVWEVITDTHLWPKWGPSVRGVQCDNRFIHLGSKGRVQTAVGIWLPFQISSYEHLRFWGWHVLGIEATGHHIHEISKDQTRLTFSMPWWSAPYVIICMLALHRIKKLVMQGDGS